MASQQKCSWKRLDIIAEIRNGKSQRLVAERFGVPKSTDEIIPLSLITCSCMHKKHLRGN